MKKVAVFLLMLTLLVVLLTAGTTFADSPKKTLVKATVTDTDMESQVIEMNPGEIRHIDMVWTGTIDLYIPETSTTPISGTYRDEITGMRVWNVPGGVEHSRLYEGVYHFKEVWTFPGGTFEGIAQVQTHGPSFTVFESHIVLQGTGVFEGQKLYLSLQRPPTPTSYFGELLIP
jgi:hypothetical protein